MTTPPPRTIGKYAVVRTLGRGGMGTVYLGKDPDLDREVAIKLIHADRADSEQTTTRFYREVLTTAGLQHPGIPPVYTLEEMPDGRAFYTMKPIDGKPLSEILEALRDEDPRTKAKYDLFRVVEILRDVAQTLHYAHNQAFIHRDLKPSNIFVGDYGEVYVIDWGLTKSLKDDDENEPARPAPKRPSGRLLVHDETVALDDSDGDGAPAAEDETVATTGSPVPPIDLERNLTVEGDILGTIAYMPPEQASGQQTRLGKEADIYALGVMLYELLTLELPFDGEDWEEIVTLKQLAALLPPEQRAPQRNIPPELSAITMQAMNPAPEERFKTAAEFERALTNFLEGKTQFRNAFRSSLDEDAVRILPRRSKSAWRIRRDGVSTTDEAPEDRYSYLLLDREFPGDVRLSAYVMLHPTSADGMNASEFALVLNAAEPDSFRNYLDCYTVHLAANQNTRAYLARNDAEVASNEYVVLEPRRRYRVSVERAGGVIRVMLNRQVILFHRDRDPLPGLWVGFLHRGAGVTFSNIRVQTRGLPPTLPSIEVPEALMAEDCYDAAEQRFLAIARGHRDRFEGAWARYRAGVASYRGDGDRKKALRIWASLRKGPFAAFEQLGRATLEMEKNRLGPAADILREVLDEQLTATVLEPIADVVFTQVQQLLRTPPRGARQWKTVDAWVRLALRLGQRVEDRKTMTPAVLWRWLLLALTRFPDHVEDCIAFLRETYGEGQGPFAQVMTAMEPLLIVLERSAEMADHPFLVDRVMRLILSHDDALGSLETLARFYLHSGHEDVALAICRHILRLCSEQGREIPAMPAAYVGCMDWLSGEVDTARKLFHLMVEQGDEWAPHDGRLLLGLDHYGRGHKKEARRLWRHVRDDANATGTNRHLVARGLLGETPPDPELADVPNRTDHRLLYCLFLGYRHYLDWRLEGRDASRNTAVQLLEDTLALMRPSYDIYSATDTFARLPLDAMGARLPDRLDPSPLSRTEREWLKRITVAAAQEPPREGRRSSTGKKKYGGKSRRRS